MESKVAVLALCLSMASVASGRPLWRVLLSYGSLQGDMPGSGPRTGTPFATPDGSVNRNIMGNTVSSTSTNGPTICLNYCGTVSGATHYNYCNAAAGCGQAQIGTCDCKAVAGAPQYYSESSGTPGDGWISGPAAKPNAGGGSNFFTDPAPKNLQGTVIASYDLGAVGSTFDCQKNCAADSNCKGFNFCTATAGCGSFAQGRCDLKTWASGPATYFNDASASSGDGWYSASRTNLS